MSSLKDLMGQRLSSVEFVQDYLQLHFDDYTLTIYNRLRLESRGTYLADQRAGFKDACAL